MDKTALHLCAAIYNNLGTKPSYPTGPAQGAKPKGAPNSQCVIFSSQFHHDWDLTVHCRIHWYKGLRTVLTPETSDILHPYSPNAPSFGTTSLTVSTPRPQF